MHGHSCDHATGRRGLWSMCCGCPPSAPTVATGSPLRVGALRIRAAVQACTWAARTHTYSGVVLHQGHGLLPPQAGPSSLCGGDSTKVKLEVMGATWELRVRVGRSGVVADAPERERVYMAAHWCPCHRPTPRARPLRTVRAPPPMAPPGAGGARLLPLLGPAPGCGRGAHLRLDRRHHAAGRRQHQEAEGAAGGDSGGWGTAGSRASSCGPVHVCYVCR